MSVFDVSCFCCPCCCFFWLVFVAEFPDMPDDELVRFDLLLEGDVTMLVSVVPATKPRQPTMTSSSFSSSTSSSSLAIIRKNEKTWIFLRFLYTREHILRNSSRLFELWTKWSRRSLVTCWLGDRVLYQSQWGV